jgi:arylsulfatase
VLELAGVTLPNELHGEPIPKAPGKSLVPAFAKDITLERDSLWWLHDGNRAVRVGDWKLVAAKNDPWELYNLETDRAEQKNLAEQMPDKVKELEKAWQDQTNSFTELAKKTITDKPSGKGKKSRAKSAEKE